MKTKVFIILVALISVFAIEATAKNQVGFATDNVLANKYIIHGAVLTDGPVFQPSATLSYWLLSFTAWGNLDLGDANDSKGEFNELEYIPDITFGNDNYSISLGAIIYDFLGDADPGSTTELYFSLGLVNALNPSFTLIQDVDVTDGTYVSLGIGPSLAIDEWNSSLDFSFALGIGTKGYNGFYHGTESGGVTDIFIGLSIPLNLSDNFSLTPSAGVAILVNGDIRDANDKTEIPFFGITFSGAL